MCHSSLVVLLLAVDASSVVDRRVRCCRDVPSGRLFGSNVVVPAPDVVWFESQTTAHTAHGTRTALFREFPQMHSHLCVGTASDGTASVGTTHTHAHTTADTHVHTLTHTHARRTQSHTPTLAHIQEHTHTQAYTLHNQITHPHNTTIHTQLHTHTTTHNYTHA